jgi:hypothetical protein
MAIEPWGLPPPAIITSSGSIGSWLGLKSSPFLAFPSSLYLTSLLWEEMLLNFKGSSRSDSENALTFLYEAVWAIA